MYGRSLRLAIGGLCVVASSTSFFASSLIAGHFEAANRRDASAIKHKIRASQFLHRATFGPTAELINELADRMAQIGVRRACEEWIDDQLEMPATTHRASILQMISDDGLTPEQDNAWIQRYRYQAWWHHAMTAPDQLRQRMAWALIQILVTSDDGAGFNDRGLGHHTQQPRWLGPTNYYDMLIDGSFGNYRDLLQDVTYHPVMGVYLSHLRNRKTSVSENRFPDENYAREIMQLFSIGLYELHVDGRLKTDENGNLIPTYDNETIKELAKVFTGLTHKPHPNANGNNRFWWGNELEYPMEMFNGEHEPGTKTLFGQTIGSSSSVDGDADISQAIDILFDHPNVAPFISRLLIQRFVKSNPSRGYIRRVARKFNNNGNGEKGDLAAVIKAILLDAEAWRSQRLMTRRSPLRVEVMTRGTEYSRLREPVIRYASMLRGLHAETGYANGWFMISRMGWAWQQAPYSSPTVFNFYLPSYQPPGDLIGYSPSRRIPNGTVYAPEFQLMTGVTANNLTNHYVGSIYNQEVFQNLYTSVSAGYRFENRIKLNLDYEKTLAFDNADVPKLLEHLDLVHAHGSIPEAFKQRIAEVVLQETAWQQQNNDPNVENERVEACLEAILLSPFGACSE